MRKDRAVQLTEGMPHPSWAVAVEKDSKLTVEEEKESDSNLESEEASDEELEMVEQMANFVGAMDD